MSSEEKDSSIPITVEDSDTARNTPTYASGEWLTGYVEGEKRGVASVLGALREALAEVGVDTAEAEAIIEKVCQRANVIRG